MQEHKADLEALQNIVKANKEEQSAELGSIKTSIEEHKEI